MGKERLKHVKTYASYSELSGSKYDKGKLVSLIQRMPLGGLFNIMSQLSFFPRHIEDKDIREYFINYVESFEEENDLFSVRDRLHGRILYTPQGLLSVWKWLLAYGDKNKLSDGVDIERGLRIIIHLCMIISDYLYDDDSLIGVEYELLRNLAFNSKEDLRSSISRARCIYKEIAQNKFLFDEKEYLDFNTDFCKHYGYSLEEYLALIFGLFALFLKKKCKFDLDWNKNLDKIFSNTALSNEASEILNPLILNFDEAQQWALNTIDAPWDFLLFQQKPLFQLSDGTFYPIMPKLLYDQFFLGLYYKIRNCYSKNDQRFLSFFGRPFESYVSMLIQESVKTSTLPYEVIPEFKYDKGEGKRSPDVILRLGNKLLVVESKSRKMTVDSLVGNDPTVVDKDMNRMVIGPLKQLHDRLIELFTLKKPFDFSDVTEIYLMVVTLGDFPTLPPFEEKILLELQQHFKLNIKSYFHLEIEEFEMFCHLISRKNGVPIFRVLDNKAKLYDWSSFKNFLFDSHLPHRRPDFVHKQGLEFTEEVQKILFPKK